MISSGAVDLRIQIGALRLANPILAASGTFGYGIEFAHLVDLNLLGGIVVKGLSLEPMEGAPAPRLCETTGGMLNAIGLQNIGVRAFVRDKLPALRGYTTAIVANVFGQTVAEYVEVIRILDDAEGLAAYELNISCPNTEAGGAFFGTDGRGCRCRTESDQEAALGKTFTQCHRHPGNRPRRRIGRGGRPDHRQYLSGHVRGLPHRALAAGSDLRGPLGPGH